MVGFVILARIATRRQGTYEVSHTHLAEKRLHESERGERREERGVRKGPTSVMTCTGTKKNNAKKGREKACIAVRDH